MTIGQQFLKEFQAEAPASRKCLERIPENLFNYKPHEKSMAMGYLALLVAEMPKWVEWMVEKKDIDFATFTHIQPKTTAELVAHFDENMEKVTAALEKAPDEVFQDMFNLKSSGKILMSMRVGDSTSSTIRHWVHHRGQLTVYMRLNNIPVPSIYGPTADENTFK